MRCAQPKTGPAFKVVWYLLPENEELSTDAVVCCSNFHSLHDKFSWIKGIELVDHWPTEKEIKMTFFLLKSFAITTVGNGAAT